MKAILDSHNAEFLFTRIHAQWSRAFTPVRLMSLLAAPGTGPLESALKEAGVTGLADPGSARAITLRFIRDLARLRSQLDPAMGLFYSAFIDRLYLDNVLLLLQIRQNLARRTELSALLLEAPELPAIHVDPLLQAPTAAHMHALLPPSPFHRRLLPILREWDAGKDLFIAGCRLDALAHATLMAAARGFDDEIAESATLLAGTETDIAHLLLLLRNLATYRLPPDRLQTIAYGSGRLIREANLAALARQTDAESLVSLIPARYAPLVRKAGPANPPAVEDALRTLHTRLVMHAFRDYANPSLSVMAYPFLKRVEALNLIRLVEGLRMGLKPDDIRRLMIGADDV